MMRTMGYFLLLKHIMHLLTHCYGTRFNKVFERVTTDKKLDGTDLWLILPHEMYGNLT
jgi:hypothetical protein